jgi:hypothetical protein
MDEQAISFGPFRLLAAQRLRLDGNNPVRLGSRAFDLLTALVEHAGEVVSKEELIARAWPQPVDAKCIPPERSSRMTETNTYGWRKSDTDEVCTRLSI